MRQYFKSYWFWFFVTLALLGLYDFIEHISRADAIFNNIYIKWFLFTLCSVTAICFAIYYINLGLRKLLKAENLFTQTAAITLAMLVHMFISGPIFEMSILGASFLNFKFNLPALLIGLCIFYLIRAVVYGETRVSEKKMR